MNEWRCMCGQENNPEKIDCRKCLKQRWAQFNLERAAAIMLAFVLGIDSEILVD